MPSNLKEVNDINTCFPKYLAPTSEPYTLLKAKLLQLINCTQVLLRYQPRQMLCKPEVKTNFGLMARFTSQTSNAQCLEAAALKECLKRLWPLSETNTEQFTAIGHFMFA